MSVVNLMILLPLSILFWQAYCYAVSKKGEEKQQSCMSLGIAYTTAGIAFLVFRSIPFAFAGFFLIMMGLRLIAHGLDRIDKKIFIDKFEEDS